jgi:hypothetical protein
MPQLNPALSDYEVDELAADAVDILNSQVFLGAVGTLRDRYISTLLAKDVASAEANTAHASLKVLNEIVQELHGFVNAKKMRDKYSKKGS